MFVLLKFFFSFVALTDGVVEKDRTQTLKGGVPFPAIYVRPVYL